MRLYLLALALFAWPAHLVGQQAIVFEGALIYPVSGPPIEDGSLVIRGSSIVAVGPSSDVQRPQDARIVDVSGKVIIPGLVDTHSHVGDVQGGDRSDPLHPEVRTLDAINVLSKSLYRARAGGITTANVMSGSGHLMSGQTTYIKTREVGTVEDAMLCEDPQTGICGGMKMANGTNSIRSSPSSFPGTRARSAALVRQLFSEAEAYAEKLQAAEDDPDRAPERDLGLEALQDVLDGRRIVHFHTHRHDDILTAIRLSQEFGFRVVLHHVSEGWRVAEEIASAGVPCSIIAIDSPGGKLEARHLKLETGSVLEQAGVDVAYHTDDYITDSRLFLRSAALGIRAGMSREAALESVTLAGARMLGLEDRVGSLEPGKDADFVILSGDPFSVYTHVLETWVDGGPVFDRSLPEDLEYATGGYGVYVDPYFDLHGKYDETSVD